MKGLPERDGKVALLRDTACSLVLGAVLAVTTAGSLATVGVRELSFLAQSSHRGLIIAAASGVVLAVAALVCYALLRNAGRLLSWADAKNPLASVPLAFERRSVLVAFAVIFICWIPWMVLQYPVAMNGDTYNQLYQFQTSSPTLYSTEGTMVDASYVDHHPVFDTLLFGAFLSLGDAVGSQNAGLFAYSVLQCALIAMGLALVCCYLERLGVPKLFRLVSLAFCALFAPLPLWSAVMVKDVINAAVLIYFALLVAEAVRSRGLLFDSKAMVVAYIVLGCLCILTKKSGVLVVGASTVALALYLRSRWAALAVGLAVPLVVCFALLPALVYPAIGGVALGGKQEAFGFALQQVITAMSEGDDLTDGEREAVAGVLDIDRAQKRYKPSIADPVKNSALDDAATGDYLRFIPAYFSIGLRHPTAYTASVFHIAGTLVTPGRTFTFADTPEQEESWVDTFAKADGKGELHLSFDKPEPVDSWMKQFSSAWRDLVPKLGPLQLFLSVGFYGGWIPLICLVVCLFNDRRYAVALVPALAVVAIILVSPASSVRYAMPLAYATPLMLGLMCASLRVRAKRLSPDAALRAKAGSSEAEGEVPRDGGVVEGS
ncbi:MAG: hypothetical protein IJ087_16340 [Eggerthellaceae bacterium]|nr:hypothetical protein [Eggerthellaceae bacterium]